MTIPKDSRLQTLNHKKEGSRNENKKEMKELLDAGVPPDETYSQDADRHRKVTHQASGKRN
jgi:hypothetical protein